MYSEELKKLIDAAIVDGQITDSERSVLYKRAEAEGVDTDELAMLLDARLAEKKKQEEEAARQYELEMARAKASAQKSAKDCKQGEAMRCPACGSFVNAYMAVCPACHYTFERVEANQTSREFADKLEKIRSIYDKQVFIETFPVPLTKADLFEFISALRPRVNDVNDPLSGAYWKKYSECIVKARSLFGNDPLFRPFLDSYREDARSLNRARLIKTVRNSQIIRVVALGALAMLVPISFLIKSCIDKNTVRDDVTVNATICQSEIDKAVAKSDWDRVLTLVRGFKYNLSHSSFSRSDALDIGRPSLEMDADVIVAPVIERALSAGQLNVAKSLYVVVVQNEASYALHETQAVKYMVQYYLYKKNYKAAWSIVQDMYGANTLRLSIIKTMCEDGELQKATNLANTISTINGGDDLKRFVANFQR